jgi:hypothetical protein
MKAPALHLSDHRRGGQARHRAWPPALPRRLPAGAHAAPEAASRKLLPCSLRSGKYIVLRDSMSVLVPATVPSEIWETLVRRCMAAIIRASLIGGVLTSVYMSREPTEASASQAPPASSTPAPTPVFVPTDASHTPIPPPPSAQPPALPTSPEFQQFVMTMPYCEPGEQYRPSPFPGVSGCRPHARTSHYEQPAASQTTERQGTPTDDLNAACRTVIRVERHTDEAITLDPGDCLLLALGLGIPNVSWSISLTDPSLLERLDVDPANLPSGVHAVYRALRPGTTILQAIGAQPFARPVPPVPPCPDPSPSARLVIVVQEGPA